MLSTPGLYGLCASSVVGACLYFFLDYVPERRAAAVDKCREELTLRAESIKASLDQWFAGGLADAEILANSPAVLLMIDGASRVDTTEQALITATELRQVVDRFVRIGSYDRYMLLDDGLHIMATIGDRGPLDSSVMRTAAEVLASGKSAVLFHRHADGSVKVAFLARERATGAGKAPGLVVLDLDPNRWLYPFLALRPMVAESAESVLMRREDDDIVFLSPLRGKPNVPLSFRRPASLPGFAARVAIEGHEGFGDYVDYRNEPVFAAAARLDRASCGLVVKVDQREALVPYRRTVRRAGTTATTSLLGFWAVAFLLFRAWRKRAEYRLESEHSLLRAMVERPDDVIVFSLDETYRYTTFNEKHRLEMKKVWNADIEVGMNMLECMRVPELRSLARQSMDRVLRGEAFWEEQRQPDLDIYYEFSWNPVRLGEKIVGVAAFVRDITARRREEAALRESEAELRAVLDAAPFPVALVDVEDNRIEFWSRSALSLFGHTAPTATGWYEIAYPDPEYRREVIERWKPALERAHAAGETVNTGEYRVTCRDGSVRLCELYARFLPNKLVVTFNDITERKRAEAALRDSEARFRATFEHATVGRSLTAADGRLLMVNQAFADMLGLSIEELQRTNFAEITHPDDIAESQECIRCLFAGERATYRMEKRYRHTDGHFMFADVSATLLRDGKGAPLYLITSISDITERKRAEVALRAALTRQQALLAAVPDIVMEVDPSKTYTWANRPGIEFFGADVVGHEAAFYFEGEQDTYESVRPLFRGDDQTIYLESWQRRRDGERRLLAWWCRPLKDETGKVTGALSTARDITERHRAEAELAAMNAELERRVAERTAELLASNQELESFAYAVSHDLRAPLRGIEGWSQAVLEDCDAQLDDQGRKYLKTVRWEAQRMAQLIDDLLNLSRVIRAPMRREPIDLSALAQELAATLRASEPARAVDFVVTPGLVAEGDPVLLRAALHNLLHNAWKFTGKRPHARVELGSATEAGRTVYHVRDDGAGFDMRYVDKLFTPFQRLHSQSEFPGTGIGLATVQRVIHRHGGKVWAAGAVDQGATFYFTLTA